MKADRAKLLKSSITIKSNLERQVQELRSQLDAEKKRVDEVWEELEDSEQARENLRSENSELKKTCAELRSQFEKERANREEVEAEREELAQLKKQVKEHAAEVHLEGRSVELEKDRWQGELSAAKADLRAAQATIAQQNDKIRELERGYSFKPNPAESRLRLEIGELQSELAELKQKSATAGKDLPEAADLLNQLKAKMKAERKKSTVSLADVESILEILEES